MSEPVIDVRDVWRTYELGRDVVVRALRGVSVAIERGDYVAIMAARAAARAR